ncbi:envelope stress response membrane protein PspB [Aliikangiella coralliicola]|uniref:Envelope stress response membrane protein PspB n=1 Tax=Aliikangiella coralliicola TaxID=2592383 RepID=A0A545UAX3_9GAMM|nr:envelope stress response membrane protein PspB [Aliikangiella coralliicola]TQV86608.1 envelope stress response membrane protein PspB [Aliikangiella coralliicola]
MEELVFVPMILFMVIVAPIWIIMHYRSKNQKESGISEADHSRLQELTKIADSMMERIENLESILDQETPEWRKKYERE